MVGILRAPSVLIVDRPRRMIWFPSVQCKKDASPIYDTGFLVLLSTEMKAAMSYTQSKIIVIQAFRQIRTKCI